MLMEQLLPMSIRKEIPPLNSNENINNPKALIKLHNPYLNWSWYIFEGEEIEEDYVFFGYLKREEEEMGYFILSDVTKCIGTERDQNFRPETLDMAKRRHQ